MVMKLMNKTMKFGPWQKKFRKDRAEMTKSDNIGARVYSSSKFTSFSIHIPHGPQEDNH